MGFLFLGRHVAIAAQNLGAVTLHGGTAESPLPASSLSSLWEKGAPP